jgi:hypothetical protein
VSDTSTTTIVSPASGTRPRTPARKGGGRGSVRRARRGSLATVAPCVPGPAATSVQQEHETGTSGGMPFTVICEA